MLSRLFNPRSRPRVSLSIYLSPTHTPTALLRRARHGMDHHGQVTRDYTAYNQASAASSALSGWNAPGKMDELVQRWSSLPALPIEGMTAQEAEGVHTLRKAVLERQGLAQAPTGWAGYYYTDRCMLTYLRNRPTIEKAVGRAVTPQGSSPGPRTQHACCSRYFRHSRVRAWPGTDRVHEGGRRAPRACAEARGSRGRCEGAAAWLGLGSATPTPRLVRARVLG